MKAIRGAITITHNTTECITNGTRTLLTALADANALTPKNVLSITFSCTRDIDRAYPAVTARELGYTDCALMCLQEMYVIDSLPMCIRVMIMANTTNSVKHCYLEGAKNLRSDLL